jgi:hypothetical protein
MASVKSIMEQHGGGITIESLVGPRNYRFTDAAGCNAYPDRCLCSWDFLLRLVGPFPPRFSEEVAASPTKMALVNLPLGSFMLMVV